MKNNRETSDLENLPTFEGRAETVLRSGRLHNLYDSPRWDEPTRNKGKGHDPRRKDHRRNAA